MVGPDKLAAFFVSCHVPDEICMHGKASRHSFI